MKLLTIGNSFSWSLRSCLPSIVEERKAELELDFANFGGCEMERHWAYVCAEENEPACRIYQDYTIKLRELLASKSWDVVSIQQASHQSWDYSKYLPYGSLLCNYVRRYAPGAKIVFQQTWSYRADAPRLQQWGFDNCEMFRRLDSAVRTFAALEKLPVIPVGLAVELARNNQPGGPYRAYDPAILKTLKWPDLPPQAGALAGRCFWRKNAQGELELARDTIHLNIRGEYLQGCVWYGFLFHKDPREIGWVPAEVADSDAKFLREIAYRALKEYQA